MYWKLSWGLYGNETCRDEDSSDQTWKVDDFVIDINEFWSFISWMSESVRFRWGRIWVLERIPDCRLSIR